MMYQDILKVRGMPHVHGVIWLNFSPEEEAMYLNPDKSINLQSDQLHILIDKFTQCKLKTRDEKLDKIVKAVNIHDHKPSCQKKGTTCRFDFPRLPSPKTLVSIPPSQDLPEDERMQMVKKANKIKEKVRLLLDEAVNKSWTLDELLKAADVSMDEYVNQGLKISERGAVVILKRDPCEAYVNNYNDKYLYAWRANIDVQFCLDTYAIVSYISDYLTKPDSGLTRLLRSALKDTKDLSDRERMHYLKRVYLTHRQVSASEATYRLLSELQLRKSSLATTFVQSNFPEERTTFLAKIGDDDVSHQDEKLENDLEYDIEDNQGEIITVAGKEGRYKKASSIHGKYSMRPSDLEDVCLAQFSTSYVYVSQKNLPKKVQWKANGNISASYSTLRSFDSDGKFLPRYIKLSDGSFMRARTIATVLRMHNSSKKKGHAVEYAELLLFFPWRDESKLHPGDGRRCVSLYESNKSVILQNHSKMLPFSSKLKEVQETMEVYEDDANKLGDLLDPTFEQEQCEDNELLEEPDRSRLPEEFMEDIPKDEPFKFKAIKLPEKEQMTKDVRSLSFEQKVVFDRFFSYCKRKSMSQSKYCMNIQPERMIVHGKLIISKLQSSNSFHDDSLQVEVVLEKAN